jgi:crotonobetainyl-CoA:carnitine CoA-transferase CaiB-like acyl-CoA transferase
MEHASGEKFRVLGSPLKMSESSVNENPLPPPILGEHSEEILQEILGLDSEAVQALRDTGAINPS